MAGGPGSSKKRKFSDLKGQPKKLVKKFKKQTDYDSGSEVDSDVIVPPKQDFQAVNLQDSDEEDDEVEDKANKKKSSKPDKHISALIEAADSDESGSGDDDELPGDEPNLDDIASESDITNASSEGESTGESDSEEEEGNSNPNLIKKKKRNDPAAFSTSISKILSSKLSTTKRSDPVLSRSVQALEASKEITDLALEKKARHKLLAEKKAALDKGRVKDVLGASTAFDSANGVGEGVEIRTVAETQELERRLRKTAQRGVVKLFNAVRAAQVKGEVAAREARQKGTVGFKRREEKVNEMSKQGFLDLIAGGGGALKAGGVEEA